MLPRLDTATYRRESTNLRDAARAALAGFKSRYAEHRKEVDAYSKLPDNPLSEVHRAREAKIKGESLEAISGHDAHRGTAHVTGRCEARARPAHTAARWRTVPTVERQRYSRATEHATRGSL